MSFTPTMPECQVPAVNSRQLDAMKAILRVHGPGDIVICGQDDRETLQVTVQPNVLESELKARRDIEFTVDKHGEVGAGWKVVAA